MPGLLYRAGMRALRFGASLAAVANPKIRARVRGAAQTLATLAPTPAGVDCYWMHCASVGEFEQGRPVWEELRRRRQGARFVLSFFSASGVEWFAGRGDLGEVVYLPWDVGGNARAFVGRLSPKLALFVKYEWWLGYHAALRERGVATVLFSVAFRQNQPFFRPWHPLRSDYREALAGVTRVFVQTETSAALLREHAYATPVSVAGDTRLDRVLAVREEAYAHEGLAAWADAAPLLLVAGSTWPPDEALLAAALAEVPELRLLCAPHEVTPGSRARLLETFGAFGPVLYSNGAVGASGASYERAAKSEIGDMSPSHEGAPTGEVRSARFADATPGPTAARTDVPWVAGARVVVLDAKGVLAKAYRYGDLAYVGGGFGAGIHNTLEPVAYGLPVAFGPRYERFDEALALVAAGVAWPCRGEADLLAFLRRFADAAAREDVLAKAAAYVAQHRGATAAITDYLAAERLI